MPFRRRFACLWCGTDWQVRSDDDLEGWAALCPDCLGQADHNGFLRSRLRIALRERARAAAPVADSVPAAASAPVVSPAATAAPEPAHDEWYLRQGRFSRGPLHDGPWAMELDEVTRWLDSVPISGTIVELAAGTGWWSTLLAEKGELWIYDASDAALEAARKRLMAHGLLAHLHQRDVLAPADKQVDVVVAAYLLTGAANTADLHARIAVVRGWLKPGGTFAFVDAKAHAGEGPLDGPVGPLWPRDAGSLRAALEAADLDVRQLSQTRSAFVMGEAAAPA